MKNMIKTISHPVTFTLAALMLAACGGGGGDVNSGSGMQSSDEVQTPRDQSSDQMGDKNVTGTGGDQDSSDLNDLIGDDDAIGDNVGDNTGDDDTPLPDEEPSLGESFYGFLCVSCHGVDGAGTDNGPSLIKLWDPLPLQNKIAADMPPDDPFACSGMCAQTTADYIADAFRPADPDDDQPPPTPREPIALISSDDNLTDFVPHSIALEARFTGVAGTPLVQWYLDEQLVAEGINYNAEFTVPGRHDLKLVITGQDDVRLEVTDTISIMAADHTVDECSPPIEFYAVRIGPNIVDMDCIACHRENGQAASSGLHFERLMVRGALTQNYNALGSYAEFPNALLNIVGGNGHDAGERLDLGNTNNPLYEDLSTFLSIEAETPPACLEE